MLLSQGSLSSAPVSALDTSFAVTATRKRTGVTGGLELGPPPSARGVPALLVRGGRRTSVLVEGIRLRRRRLVGAASGPPPLALPTPEGLLTIIVGDPRFRRMGPRVIGAPSVLMQPPRPPKLVRLRAVTAPPPPVRPRPPVLGASIGPRVLPLPQSLLRRPRHRLAVMVIRARRVMGGAGGPPIGLWVGVRSWIQRLFGLPGAAIGTPVVLQNASCTASGLATVTLTASQLDTVTCTGSQLDHATVEEA